MNCPKAGRKLKVTSHAFDDMLMIGGLMFTRDETGAIVTNDNAGMAGLSATVWLTEQQKARPHWFPESHGAGATGNKGNGGQANPFSKDGWNMTEQGKLLRDDPETAHQMAKAAGTTVGGKRPS